MTVQHLMEICKVDNVGFAIEFIKEGLRNIQINTRENIVTTDMSIVANVEDYNFPTDMERLISVDIVSDPNETNYVLDWNKYLWYNNGRTFKLQKLDSYGLYNTPNTSYTNGIRITYATTGAKFVYNPDGDSTYYSTGGITSGAEILIPDTSDLLNTIIYIASNVYASKGLLGHYYKRTAYNKITDSDDLVDGDVYMISSQSAINFVTWGASAATVGIVFKYSEGAGAPTLSYLDSVEWLGTPIETGNLTIGKTYMISAVSVAEDFTLDGAGADTFGTVFTATDDTITLTAADSVIALPLWETIDFLDTDLWTDVTEQTTPTEASYINIDEHYTQALIEFVKSKITEDVKLAEYRERKYTQNVATATKKKDMTVRKIVPPRVYSLR